MNNLKKYAAAFAIALMTGFGVFSVVTAINAQTDTNQKQNVQKEQKDSKDELNESEENEANENENEADENEAGEEADENESEEGEENEADEQAEQAALAKEANISRQQAEAIALGKISGTIVEGDLEKENGKLVYGFDIRNSENQMFDVEVDANTGEVLKAQPDTEDDGENEANEAAK